MKCRICRNEDLNKILSLGESPLANNFLRKEDLDKEENKFPLELYLCNKCKLVQLGHVVDPELMFKHYVYVSSTTKTFQIHFNKMAEDISRDFNLNDESLAVDIGSNDGLLLKGFQKLGVNTIGIEPATNLAKIAEENSVETINDFFNNEVVKKIIGKKGKADVITANNVFAHIDDIHAVVENVKNLIKEDGIFVIEVQYLVDTIEKMTFDNVYHEHLSYYSLMALDYFFRMHDMIVFDVKHVDTHGGSLRVFVKKKEGKHEIKQSVKEIMDYEKKIGIDDIDLYQKFADKVNEAKKILLDYLNSIKKQGKTIAGYGAPAKSTTLLNFLGTGNNDIKYIVDDNPLKAGLFAPGTRIPVVSLEYLEKERPDYILILAWNFAEEILKKTNKLAEDGIKFIIPLPKPKIV